MGMDLPVLNRIRRFTDQELEENLSDEEAAAPEIDEFFPESAEDGVLPTQRPEGVAPLSELATQIPLTQEQIDDPNPIDLDEGQEPISSNVERGKDFLRGAGASIADSGRHLVDATGVMANTVVKMIRDPEFLKLPEQEQEEIIRRGVHGNANSADEFRAPQDQRTSNFKEADVNFYGNDQERHALNKYIEKNAANGGEQLVGSYVSEQLKRIADETRAARTPEFQAKNKVLAEKVAAADDGMDKFVAGFKGIVTDPELYGAYTGEVLGSLASQIVGGVITKGMRLGATVGSVGMGMITSGGAASDAAFEEIMSQSPTMFRSAERYAELGRQGFSDEEARERLAYELSQKVGLSTALVTGITSMMPGFGRVDRLLGGGLRRSERGTGGVINAVTGAIKSGIGEAGQEVVENEFAGFGTNVVIKEDLDPTRSLLEGFGDSGTDAALGFSAGVTTHAGVEGLNKVMGRGAAPDPNAPPAGGNSESKSST